MTGGNLYPAPTLQVFPGETLIVHLANDLAGLTIHDFFIPQYTAKGEEVPLYPGAADLVAAQPACRTASTSARKGNSDNVMLHIPAGMAEHLHLRHSRRTCRRARTGTTAICTP